jgi:hypothetical protein
MIGRNGSRFWTIAALVGLVAAGQARAEPGGGLLPMPGKSLGGVVRAAPGMASARLTALHEGYDIEILENAAVSMNGYDWFKIRYGGRIAYQWGGVMCSKAPLAGIYQTCP